MEKIYAVLRPEKIDMLSKLLEGFEGLGVVSTLDRQLGLVLIRVTHDTGSEVLEVLQHFPFPIQVFKTE
jgi:putative protease